MDKNKKNLIITLTDENFVNQAKQLFSSVYLNSGWEGEYMLLTNNLSLEDTLWFESRGILVYDQPLLTSRPLGAKAYPPILLSKFYFFKEDFKKWNKIIFLDADIIVKASLNRLLKLKSFNAPLAAGLRLKDEFINKSDNLKKLGEEYDLKRVAFNSGVFVFDTSIIKRETFNDLILFYEKYKNISEFGDESILNLFFYKKWKLLPIIYNSTPHYMKKYFGINKNKLLAIIIHFVCAKIKPWNPKSTYYEEWSHNFKKADKIDLNSRLKASKIYSNWELYSYNRYFKQRQIICFLRPVFFFIDRQIGRVGLFVKKISPSLYNVIRIKKDE